MTGERFALIGCLLLLLAAAEESESPAQARFRKWAEDTRAEAQEVRRQHEQFVAELAGIMDFAAEDLAGLNRAVSAEVKSKEREAEAWAAGEEVRARQVRIEADAARAVSGVWRERISSWRRRQASAFPDEHWYRESSQELRPELLPFLDEVVRARRKCAEAWGRLAEATLPGADEAVLDRLYDAASAAEIVREMAEWKLAWEGKLIWAWWDRSVASPQLSQKLQQLRDAEEDRLRLRQEDIERERRARQLEKTMQRLRGEIREAHDQARRQRPAPGNR